MKKLFTYLLIFIPFFSLFSQEVYLDTFKKNGYLFLGSISDDFHKFKVLEIKSNQIRWIQNENLEQADQLSPSDFTNKIFSQNLIFVAEGSEPFWRAEIDQDSLTFIDPLNADKNKFDIHININKNNSGSFPILMFHNNDKTIYGVIRRLYKPSACTLCVCEEESLFEIFLNYEGTVYTGCTIIAER